MIRKWSASFTARVLVLLVLVSVVPLVGMGIIYDRYTQDMLGWLNRERVAGRLEEASDRVRLFVKDRFNELNMLADHPVLRSSFAAGAARDGSIQTLLEYQPAHASLYDIVLLDEEGRVRAVFASRDDSVDWRAAEPYLPVNRVQPRRGQGIAGPITVPGAESPVFFLYQRVYDDPEQERALGMVTLQFQMEAFLTLLRQEQRAAAIVPLIRTPEGNRYPARPVDLGGRYEIAGVERIFEGWSVAVAVDRSRMMAPLRQLRETLLGILAATVAGLLVVIGWFYRRSATRIRQLTEGAEAIAHGDLRWRLEDRGRDEFAALSRSFNRMAEQLRELIDTAVQREKMASLGRLATTIAHEVRNPLASMKTGAQVVREELERPEPQRIQDHVIHEIDRLSRVATELLDFARPVASRQQDHAVRTMIERVCTLVEREAHKSRVRIAVDAEESLSVHVDPDQVQQVLMNLVLNSLKAMPDGGELSLSAHRRDHRVEIVVRDTGQGIEPDLLERVSRPFVSSSSDGVGIGLSVSQQIVERNQGHMDIASTPGRGTTVTLSFPAGGAAQAPPAAG